MSYRDKVTGALLGALCGDALGAAVEGSCAADVAAFHPAGLTTMIDHDGGRGRYTDDFEMTAALTTSLVRRGCCDALDAAAAYAEMFNPRRGYAPMAVKALSALRRGEDPRKTGRMCIQEGSFGNGGAMRIAPVGLAYRNAPPAVLSAAVRAALLPTHCHPLGVDGALMQAAAVGWLSTHSVADPGCTPRALLEHLVGVVETEEARERLAILQQVLTEKPALVAQPPVASWEAHLQSDTWLKGELTVSASVAPGFQIEATSAAAAALWAFIAHWKAPADAMIAAVHLGGDTDTIASMVGAMAGALHGTAWLPKKWLDEVENGPRGGRDTAKAAAVQLAALDCREQPPAWE